MEQTDLYKKFNVKLNHLVVLGIIMITLVVCSKSAISKGVNNLCIMHIEINNILTYICV